MMNPHYVARLCWLLLAASVAFAAPPTSVIRQRQPTASNLDHFEEWLRLQIFLDSEGFGPGKIDGQSGEFTRKAIAAWNVVHGIEDSEDPYPAIVESQRQVSEIYAAYRIKIDDLDFLTESLPDKPTEQAELDYLGYRSLGEFVAERYHTTEAFLAKINRRRSLPALRPGHWVRVPNVEPFQIEKLSPQQSWPTDATLGAHAVLVDTAHRTASFYDEERRLFASFPITPGEKKFVPLGEWKMEVMLALPQFRWDKQMLEQGKRSKDARLLPPGPNSPVGVLWAGLNKSGIGLHGTAAPETIGRSRSAGCIRFANWDAARLPTLIRPGSRVLIR